MKKNSKYKKIQLKKYISFHLIVFVTSFPSSQSHHCLEHKKPNSIYRERSQHCDAISFEKCLYSFLTVFLNCAVPHPFVSNVFQMLRLNNSLNVVNRIGKKPRSYTSDSSCQESSHNWGFRGIISFWRENSHAILISSEVFTQSNHLS